MAHGASLQASSLLWPVRILCSSSSFSRHRVQAATTQGMAANPHSKDRPADSLPHRLCFCAHRWSSHLGLLPRLRNLL